MFACSNRKGRDIDDAAKVVVFVGKGKGTGADGEKEGHALIKRNNKDGQK